MSEIKITPEQFRQLSEDEQRRVLGLLSQEKGEPAQEAGFKNAESTQESFVKSEPQVSSAVIEKPQVPLTIPTEQTLRGGSENLTEEQRKEILSKILQGDIKPDEPSDLVDLIMGK